MKPSKVLIRELKSEYLSVQDLIARACFALETLPLNDIEHQLLEEQIDFMCDYAARLKDRAGYAAKKDIPVEYPDQKMPMELPVFK